MRPKVLIFSAKRFFSSLLYSGLLLVLFSACAPAERDCEKFRNGKFRLEMAGVPKTVVTRTDSIQLEQRSEGGVSDRYRIRWIDDCTYEARLITTNDTSERAFSMGEAFQFTITNTFAAGYGFKVRLAEKWHTGKMMVVEE